MGVLVTFLVVGLESWGLCLLCRHAASELHPQPPLLCIHWAPMGVPVLYPPQQVDDVIIVCKGEGGSLMTWMLALRHVPYVLTF